MPLSRAVECTVTSNAHAAGRPNESDALHVTPVRPSGNALPDAGVQVTDTGGAPPDTVGANVSTAVDAAVPAVSGTGHASDRGPTGSGTGDGDDLPLQPRESAATANATRRRRWGMADTGCTCDPVHRWVRSAATLAVNRAGVKPMAVTWEE